jgi:hypothetical protein
MLHRRRRTNGSSRVAPNRVPRRRLAALTIGAVGIVGTVLVGLALTIGQALDSGLGSSPADRKSMVANAGSVPENRERKNDAPVLAGSATDRLSSPSSSEKSPSSEDSLAPILLPASRAMGPRSVVTGYPMTPQGAMP